MEKGEESVKFYLNKAVICICCGRKIDGTDVAYVDTLGYLCEQCAWNLI